MKEIFFFSPFSQLWPRRAILAPGGGVLPYMAYTGMCRWTGYSFWSLCPKQGM